MTTIVVTGAAGFIGSNFVRFGFAGDRLSGRDCG